MQNILTNTFLIFPWHQVNYVVFSMGISRTQFWVTPSKSYTEVWLPRLTSPQESPCSHIHYWYVYILLCWGCSRLIRYGCVKTPFSRQNCSVADSRLRDTLLVIHSPLKCSRVFSAIVQFSRPAQQQLIFDSFSKLKLGFRKSLVASGSLSRKSLYAFLVWQKSLCSQNLLLFSIICRENKRRSNKCFSIDLQSSIVSCLRVSKNPRENWSRDFLVIPRSLLYRRHRSCFTHSSSIISIDSKPENLSHHYRELHAWQETA